MALLDGMTDDPDRGNEAKMFLDQLTTTWQRYGN